MIKEFPEIDKTEKRQAKSAMNAYHKKKPFYIKGIMT